MKLLLTLIVTTISLSLHADQEWYADVGAGLAVVNYPISVLDEITEWRPTISAGFTKVIDENWQLRSAVDLLFAPGNNSDSDENLLNWRMAEIDYRLADNWALTAYLGLARYYREYPAFGYSQGLGVKYRLSSRWLFDSLLQTSNVDTSNSIPIDPAIGSSTRFYWLSATIHYAF